MTVRELLVRMGFSMDQAKAKQAEATIEGIKNKASSAVSVITGIGAALGVAFGLDKLTQVVDEWTNVDSRIGLVTSSAEEQKQVLESIYDISNRTRQEYTATGDLFTKLSRGSKEFGASQDDVLSVTETINKALVVGGASTAEAQSTILQLGQALSSGRLQGDELRSLGENAPMLMAEVAKAYGVTVGQLKQLGADGELESKGVFDAILKAKAVMDAQFEKMPMTIGQAVTVAGNKFGKFVSEINKATGASKAIAAGIVGIMTKMENGMKRAAKAVGGFGNLFKIAGAMMAAFGAAMVYLKWAAIKAGILSVVGALRAFAMNPATWTALAIAAAVLLIALAFEDLYTWINGGDSLIGEWLGPWDEFKAKALAAWKAADEFFKNLPVRINATITEIGNWFNSLWDEITTYAENAWNGLINAISNFFISLWNGIEETAISAWNTILDITTVIFNGICSIGEFYLNVLLTIWQGVVEGFLMYLQFWRQIFEGDFSGAINTVIGFFQNLLATALKVLSQIGSAIGRYVLSKLGVAGQMLAKMAGIDLSGVVSAQNVAGAGGGGTNNSIEVNVTTPEGTTAAQADYIQQSAEQSYGGVFDSLAYAGGPI